MIRQILTSAILLTTVMVNPILASSKIDFENPDPITVNNSTTINKITIYGHVDIILVPDESSDVTINGGKDGAEKVKLVYQNNKLEVIASYFDVSNKPVVRIPAKNLAQLEINGNGRIYSESILNNSKLDVFINGSCNVHLRSRGKIQVYASPEYELKYTKNEVINPFNNIL